MSISAERVFHYFKEICKIPHGSGETEKIAEYCVDYAKKHDYRYIYDDAGNVIIYADGTCGLENKAPVVIQGHLDMVCEKTAECTKDMSREGIDVYEKDGWLTADGTTLGGDDGIAIAYILALLEDNTIPHPPVEALLTKDEETGMYGAKGLDGKNISGKRVINLDSEEEGILTVSCAGGARIRCTLNGERIPAKGKAYKINIGGLKGGHSGIEIHKNRTNASVLLARVLYSLGSEADFVLSEITGGSKMNVITKSAEAVIVSENENIPSAVSKLAEALSKELSRTEPDLKITAEECALPETAFDKTATDKIIFFLYNITDGVIEMSPDIDGLVQTSVNLGVLNTNGGAVFTEHLSRSNASDGLGAVCTKFESFIKYIGGEIECEYDYPAWEYRENSPLRDTMVKVYEEMYGKKPVIAAIHAGLECGIFAEKLDDADMVSFGPDIENVHTPDERLNIASVERGWEYLLKVLSQL
ncbi:MAG: aminoacyl-histidine dipeptidase [Oscillospiraceae bacterium]|nr:aminoacyl-histidine dipeptidase [Oscillospiraceae bacterium]